MKGSYFFFIAITIFSPLYGSLALLFLMTFTGLPREVLSSQRHPTSLPILWNIPILSLTTIHGNAAWCWQSSGYTYGMLLSLPLNFAHAVFHSINNISNLLFFKFYFLYISPCYHHPCLEFHSSTFNAYILASVASFQIASHESILHLQNFASDF